MFGCILCFLFGVAFASIFWFAILCKCKHRLEMALNIAIKALEGKNFFKNNLM